MVCRALIGRRLLANIPHFTPTSSPALDSLLTDIRTKIILPAYLPLWQRKKLSSKSWEQRLQSDPIIMEIDGEVFKFRYQNPLTDVPNTRKSLWSAVSQFETAADFENLKPLLEGIQATGSAIQQDFFARLTRIVGGKGHVYHLIDCARCARRTGYKLDSSEKVVRVLYFVQMKARDADWDEAETRQALRWAEMVVEMLHDDAHQFHYRKRETALPGEIHASRDPLVLAAPLHLAAVLAARYEVGEEILEKVHKLARDIVAVWPEGKKLTELQPAELYADFRKMGYLLSSSKFAILAIPLLHGLETAAKVVEPELASQLQARCDTLAAQIKEVRDAQPPDDSRVQDMYEKFNGA